jgi:DHA2 family multidrug resistance protein
VAVFVVAAYMFTVHVSTVEHAFIDVRIFADRNFLAGLLLMFAIGGILLATLALLTPFLERLLNYPVLEAELVLAPRGVGTMLSMLVVGRIINRVGSRPLIVLGLALTALALRDMSLFTLDTSHQAIIRTGLIQGVGLGLVFVPLSAATFATLAPRFRTQGTALFNLMRNVGSSIGISITSTLFIRYSIMMHASVAESINPFRTALQPYAGVLALNTSQGRALFDLQVTQQAMAIGYEDNFHLMMYASIALIPLVLLLRPETPPPRPA